MVRFYTILYLSCAFNLILFNSYWVDIMTVNFVFFLSALIVFHQQKSISR